MTKIANTPAYQIKENIVLTDYFPGTNSETEKLETVSFRFQDVQKYLLSGLTPETGGTLRITEISYSGEGYGTASELLNALDPNYVIMRYHVVIVSVNSTKSLLKLQDITVGLGQDEVTDSDFILFPTSVGPSGNSIVSIAKTNTAGLVDTYTITFSDATTFEYDVTNGTNGSNGDPGATGNGIASIVKTNTVGLVDTYTVMFTNSTTTTFTVTNGAKGDPGTDFTKKTSKEIIASYPLTADDDSRVIYVNSESDVTITVPDTGLPYDFGVGFVHVGNGDILFSGAGSVDVTNPIGLKSKGKGYSTFILRKELTNKYNLLGNTKA